MGFRTFGANTEGQLPFTAYSCVCGVWVKIADREHVRVEKKDLGSFHEVLKVNSASAEFVAFAIGEIMSSTLSEALGLLVGAVKDQGRAYHWASPEPETKEN